MKSCTSEYLCEHKKLGGIFYECGYFGYCDFQLPRDSRIPQWGQTPTYQQCTCGITSNLPCPIHGKR